MKSQKGKFKVKQSCIESHFLSVGIEVAYYLIQIVNLCFNLTCNKIRDQSTYQRETFQMLNRFVVDFDDCRFRRLNRSSWDIFVQIPFHYG